MAVEPSAESLREWHRRFAIDANNRAWQLTEMTSRSAAEDAEMMHVAHASAWHWSKAGNAHNAALADMLLAQVHALLGHGALAVPHAQASFAYFTGRESAPWELAFAHAVRAHAASAAHDDGAHRRHWEEARALGARLEAEDRKIFDATFRTIPPPSDSDLSAGI
jgi:hypothetical protein